MVVLGLLTNTRIPGTVNWFIIVPAIPLRRVQGETMTVN